MTGQSNPLFRGQWHLSEIGNLQAVWRDYTGAGVTVLISDSGVERDHPDLDDNALDRRFNGPYGSDDGLPRFSSSGHGTSVAGLVAAENNGIGGVGVAFDAGIASVNLIDNGGGPARAEAMVRYGAQFDVVNNSWGYQPSFNTPGAPRGDPERGGSGEGRAVNYAADTGRDGLGTIFVFAGGNNYVSSQGDWLNSLHQSITVAATSRGGWVESYSNHGTNLLIAAPAANLTTDLTGSAGYAAGPHTGQFGGTSAATPIVSGVVALMLEAAPGLGWRDVQNILALSASQTGSAYGGPGGRYEHGAWFANDAETWNGGGLTYHASYGYGMVDVHAAVRMAEAWSLFRAGPLTSANERVVDAVYTGPPRAIRDLETTRASIAVQGNIEIEHIYVEVSGDHTYFGDLGMTLISPSGERYELVDPDGRRGGAAGDWTFGVAVARGDTSRGTWQVEVSDNAALDTGTLRDIRLTFTGSPISVDDVYTITQDYRSLAAIDRERQVIMDDDGGTDWLNLVALQGNVALSMGVIGGFSVNGLRWATLSAKGGLFERAALGDGLDFVTGNAAANFLSGGRGGDRLAGEGGRDSLHGEAGHDRLFGGGGDDLLRGGSGLDFLAGGQGRDRLYGGAEGDVLDGGSQNDILSGERGHDRVRGGDGSDQLYGGPGFDALHGQSGDDRAFGDSGNDLLSGGGGDDRLRAGQGNDRLIGGPGNDRLFGGGGNDVLQGDGGDDVLLGQDGADRMFGGSGSDFLSGGKETDSLYGGASNDILDGGTGNDRLEGGGGADTFLFRDGDGVDRVTDFDVRVDRLRLDRDLAGAGLDGQDVVDAHAEIRGDGVLFEFDDGQSILLVGLGSTDGLGDAISFF